MSGPIVAPFIFRYPRESTKAGKRNGPEKKEKGKKRREKRAVIEKRFNYTQGDLARKRAGESKATIGPRKAPWTIQSSLYAQ